ncbi:uncharacterized protein LOC115449446 [Manduca sexta]|uniref:uncharacterized protein LOC115449446 n=1 Tax=Manduca sexta TaxID=7130 RepID=UPI00188DFD0D|nr:uncharacterized protein LOC115449446 [Manduca sexta]XP_037295905.1 uncharacterized protein LOC115449446 [Manduca sexta]
MVIPLISNTVSEGNNDNASAIKDVNEETIELAEDIKKQEPQSEQKEPIEQAQKAESVKLIESEIKEEIRSDITQQTEQEESAKEEQIELAESVQERTVTTKYDLGSFLCDFICCCCSGYQEGDLDVANVDVQSEPVFYRGLMERRDRYSNEAPVNEVDTCNGNDHGDGSHIA